MQVGCLGNISFIVSDREIMTINNFKKSGSAKYATHQRVASKELPEMTGIGLDSVTFDMLISAYLGADPQSEIKKIERAMKSGKVMRLVIGDDYIGRYVIQSYSESASAYHAREGITAATVSVTLLEYVEG